VKDINAEANPQLQKIKSELIANTDAYKANTVEYKKNRDDALNIMLDVKNSYTNAKACYTAQIKNTLGNQVGKVQNAQNEISQIDSTLSTTVDPRTLNLLTLAKEADARLKTLTDIQDQANAAKTLNDISGPSQKYATILASGQVTTGLELSNSRTDLENIQNQSASLKLDANRRWQMCQATN
jgi:hypothetical protein